jgi:hypothetical protein
MHDSAPTTNGSDAMTLALQRSPSQAPSAEPHMLKVFGSTDGNEAAAIAATAAAV